MKRVIVLLGGVLLLGCSPDEKGERAEAETQAPPRAETQTLAETETKASAASETQASAEAICKPDGSLAAIPQAPEASSAAASVRTAGMLWTNNDDGTPMVLAVDERGQVTGRVVIAGAEKGDWEALAVGKCSAGSCLYVADIGDNDASRKGITVYRVPEPLPTDSVSAPAQAFHGTYPDGAHDAEAIWVTGQREVFIVTKGETGPVAIYQFPPQTAQNGKTVELKRVVELSEEAKRKEMITDASMSPDGKWVALRTNRQLLFYRAEGLRSGKPASALQYDLSTLREPQGEGVAFGNDGTIYLTGEGGGKGRPGTLARLRCTLERQG